QPIVPDSDGDGIADVDEDAGGNPADKGQQNVVTLPDTVNDGRFITLTAPAGVNFQTVRPEEDPAPDDSFAPSHTQFPLGFFAFQITPVGKDPVIIDMTLPVPA